MKPITFLPAVVSFVSLGVVQAKSVDNWVSTIWDDFKGAVDCGLKLVAGLGEPMLEDVLTGVCKLSGVVDFDVCDGVMANEGPAVHYSLKNLELGSHTAQTLCASLVKLCNPAVRPYNISFPSSKPPTTRPRASGRSPIKVVHFSDTHVDLSYEVGSNYDCSKPICCRAYTEKDAPGNNSSPCGPWGNPNCDPPRRLQESMMAAIAELQPAFSIYTGDVVAHDLWLVNQTEVLESFNATYGAMENLGLVYAALGNHDTAPPNLFPSAKIPSEYNPQWAYDALVANWKILTGLPSVEEASKYGSYSAVHPNSKLRIISYNSVFYYKLNFFAYEEPMQYDPNDQLAWLITELSAAERAGQRVWLISHIPSGSADHFPDHSHYMDQIVQRYEATIAALFFGHTHRDGFQITYSDYSNRLWDTATAIGYIAPSMTPTSGPPSFRVYEVDPDTFGVLDFTQYIAHTGNSSHEALEWIPYYSVKKDYGSKLTPPLQDPHTELTPAFWHNVSVMMERDPAVFRDFWARRTRGYKVPSCAGDCVKDEICTLRSADAQYRCAGKSKGFDLTKCGYTELEKRLQPEYNHAGMAPLLAKIAHRASLARQE